MLKGEERVVSAVRYYLDACKIDMRRWYFWAVERERERLLQNLGVLY